MIEKFPSETSKEKDEGAGAELPEDVFEAIRGEKGEYNVMKEGGTERRINRIDEWLSTVNTEKELRERFDQITNASEKIVYDEGSMTIEIAILQELLIRYFLKNRKKEIER